MSKTTAVAGITKARNGFFTAWAKAAGHGYADASLSGLELSEARAHREAMLATVAGVADPGEQARRLHAYQRAHA